MSGDASAVEVIPPDDPRAVAVAARLHPERFKLLFVAFELPADPFGDLGDTFSFGEPQRPRPRRASSRRR